MKTPQLNLIDRNSWLVQECRGKTVLHIGCTAFPAVKRSLDKGDHLHWLLFEVTSELIGVDLSEEGIKELKETNLFPEDSLIVHNGEELQTCPALDHKLFEVIVAGDVIEHVNNVGSVIEGMIAKLQKGGKILITVPHTYALKRFLPFLLFRHEHVHPDHTGYFSYSTLSQILKRYGLEIKQIHGFQWKSLTTANRLVNALLLPILWLTRGGVSDELAIECRRIGE